MAMRFYISNEEAPFFDGNKMGYANSIPTSGTYKVGDFIISSTQANGIFGWVCIKAGTPGTWEVIGSGYSSSDNKYNELVCLRNNVTISTTVSQMDIGISDFDKNNDVLLVYKNSTYLIEDVDYTISDDSSKIISSNGNWNVDAEDDFIFSFIVLKEVATSNPNILIGTENIKNGAVTMEKLADDVKEAIENGGGGSIDTSIYALKSDLNTTNNNVTAVTNIANNNKTDISNLTNRVSANETNITTVTNTANAANTNATSAINIGNLASVTANTNKTNIGTIGDLNTSAKDNLVNAINEINTKLGDNTDLLINLYNNTLDYL